VSRLHELLGLSAEVEAGRLGVAAAAAELLRIESAPSAWPRAVVVLAYGVYGAAVAARVGGRGWEMLAAGLIGLLVGFVQQGYLRFATRALEKGLLGTFAATVAACLLRLVLPPFDLERAVFGAITLLVPAMVLTIGAEELVSETAPEAGLVRFAYGGFQFLMMALGIVAAAKVWSLFGPIPRQITAEKLPAPAVIAILVPGGLALVACVRGRMRDAGWMVLAVLFAWGAQESTKLAFGGSGSPFLTTFALGVLAQLYARRPGRLPGTVIFPGLMQITPGFLGASAVVALLRQSEAESNVTFFHVLLVVVQIVCGLLAASFVHARRPSATGGEA
jgi:uncharacterized membrane protein YjjP (DUF1212 family)